MTPDGALGWVEAIKAGGPYLICVVLAWALWVRDRQLRQEMLDSRESLVELNRAQVSVSERMISALDALRDTLATRR